MSETCLNLLVPNAFHRMTFIGVIVFAISGAVFLTAFTSTEVLESRLFRCYTLGGKQTARDIQEQCYKNYNIQHNGDFPYFAFVLLNFPLVLLVCLIYSQYVKPQVDKETNRSLGPWRFWVFTVYAVHLLIRSIVVAVFLVLQWGYFYPVKFPPQHDCLAPVHNSTTAANATMEPLTYDCKNSVAHTKSSFGYGLFAVNLLFLVLSSLEVVHLACNVKNRDDQEFCRDYFRIQVDPASM